MLYKRETYAPSATTNSYRYHFAWQSPATFRGSLSARNSRRFRDDSIYDRINADQTIRPQAGPVMFVPHEKLGPTRDPQIRDGCLTLLDIQRSNGNPISQVK